MIFCLPIFHFQMELNWCNVLINITCLCLFTESQDQVAINGDTEEGSEGSDPCEGDEELEADEVNLRAFLPACGPIIFELLEMPPQPKTVNNWTFRKGTHTQHHVYVQHLYTPLQLSPPTWSPTSTQLKCFVPFPRSLMRRNKWLLPRHPLLGPLHGHPSSCQCSECCVVTRWDKRCFCQSI